MSSYSAQRCTTLHLKEMAMQHPFQLVIRWQEPPMEVKKKDVLPQFVSVNALLFSIQYRHVSFP